MIDIKSIWAQQNPSSDLLINKTRLNAVAKFRCYAATNHVTGNLIFLLQVSLSTDIPTFRNFKFKGVKIEIFKFEDCQELTVYLIDNDLKDIFALFVENIVEEIISSQTENEAVSRTVNVIFRWKKLFEKLSGSGLSIEQQKGLLGELLFIKELLESGVSINKILNAWTGPDFASKDFNFPSASFEVKFTTSNVPCVKITNENQLDNFDLEPLFVVQFLSEPQKKGGISLNSMVNFIKENLESNKTAYSIFSDKLESVGFFEEDRLNYDSEYSLKSFSTYKVTESFPRICRNNLPTGVYSVSYSIERSALEDFKEDLENIISFL